MPSRTSSVPPPLGFDRWDLLWPIAPKPLLVGISAHDYFGSTYSPSYETSGQEGFEQLCALTSLAAGRGWAAICSPPRRPPAARSLLSIAVGHVQLV